MDVENFLSKINKLINDGGDVFVPEPPSISAGEIGRGNGSVASCWRALKNPMGPKAHRVLLR